MSGIIILEMAKAMTLWMNSTRVTPPPVWEQLPNSIKAAYLEQARAAYEAALPHLLELTTQKQLDVVESALNRAKDRDEHITQLEAQL